LRGAPEWQPIAEFKPLDDDDDGQLQDDDDGLAALATPAYTDAIKNLDPSEWDPSSQVFSSSFTHFRETCISLAIL
jgi:hypothetical protein